MDPPELQIPSSYCRIIARMLELHERELPALLAGTGLPVSILQPGDETPISGDQQIRVLENGYRLMEGPGFGLALGRQLGPASHGPVGYLSLASRDLHSALMAYADFLPTRLPIIELHVTLSDQWLDCGYRILLEPPDHIRQSMAESFAVSVQAIVEEILRREAGEAEIAFSHPKPGHAQLYGELLHGHCRFGAEQTRYRLPAELAHTPNTAGDAEAFRVTRDLCQSLLQKQAGQEKSVSERVRTVLLSQPQDAVNETRVAKAMFVSKRTLARRLEQEGTSYRKIRDQVLCELACGFLSQTNQSVESIAASLGYHDSAAFRKAFRRWMGVAPGEYRLGQ